MNKTVIFFLLTFTSIASLASPVGQPKFYPLKPSYSDMRTDISFEQSWRRYPSPDTILLMLRQKFPSVFEDNSDSSFFYSATECIDLTEENRANLGDNSPVTGAPLVDNPNSSFVVWYSNCLKKLLAEEKLVYEEKLAEFSEVKAGEVFASQYFGKEIAALCVASEGPDSQYVGSLFSSLCLWSKLSESQKMNRVTEMIEEFIGPEPVLQDLEIASSANSLAEKIVKEIDDYASSEGDRYEFLDSSGQQMSVIEALQIAKFLILMTDHLRY